MYTQEVSHTGSNEKNKMLSDTYKLLSASIIWSGVVALISMFMGMPAFGMTGMVIFFVAYFGLLFAINKNRHSATGVYLVFALTGLLGLTLAPMLTMVIGAGKGGLIATSLIGTGLIFFVAAHIGKNTEKDLSGMAKLVFPVLIIGFIAGLVNAFVFQSPIMANIVSVLFLVCSSFVIAWQINSIIKGGEDSYISATVTLYVSLYNIFTSILQLLLSSDD
jgi:modulator of FtsH protease